MQFPFLVVTLVGFHGPKKALEISIPGVQCVDGRLKVSYVGVGHFVFHVVNQLLPIRFTHRNLC